MIASSQWAGLELRHLITLEAVARHRSFRKAALCLNYTQSGISQQVAALERIVGERLIERPGGSRPVGLTDAGEIVLRHSRTGRVALVGAGPGDPELLTLKAQRKLNEADVIVHDRLVGPGILEYARRDAIRIAVGKAPGKPSPTQSAITAILIREAGKGLNVVRLKGGDPYVFGRGGEEQAALEAAGIPVEIVPGITAALGCAASIGLPLTQRGRNTAITLITGASEDGIAEQDWGALAKAGTATAVYMGVGAAPHIAARLIAAGIEPATPVTIVENGTLQDERTIATSVARLGQAARAVNGPAIIYIGLTKARQSGAVLPFPAAAANAVLSERRAS